MAKSHRANGKTPTHFEQIPVAIVEKIAIADLPDDRKTDRRLVDREVPPGDSYEIRRSNDRRKSPTQASPPENES